MKVQKFRAKTSVEALAKVKEALGEDAVILATRRVKEGRSWLYEITAAIDLEPPEPEIKPREKEGFSLVLREIESLKEIVLGLEASLKPRGSWAEIFLQQGVPARVIKLLGGNGNASREAFLKNACDRVPQKIGPKELSRTMVFIGQAGVGKTTTLVKLAARLTASGKKVALVSLDTVRVGAKEQISRFAGLLELPLFFTRVEEFAKEKQRLASYDFILVDTPAFGPGFSEYYLKDLLADDEEVSFHLVVRAPEITFVLPSLWQRLKNLPVASLILTHVEGLPSGGPLFSLFLPGLPPVSFISTGDRVPEDFERLTPKRLLGLLLRNLELEARHVTA
ncbi:flagellar biosynthesis protein FlhF [Thermodesulfatator atlanticus]|uniref:flagellar biosynthesis protein FlhF n=1 Tax=Thermodesulfatator atlanticus TaxID=501497 RepID=UPI0003B60E9C|nr:hypothetical protein [Thermodesulfatator atlanticus]